jgi:nitrogen fixation protein NifB
VKCRFCERKFDCANESRPGVTSAVLTPVQAADYFDKCVAAGMKVGVAGIAGPGDAFANAKATLETLRLVRERHPDIILCVSTNGVDLEPNVPALAELKLSHVTVTVNAITPETAAKVYEWVRYKKRIYRGLEAGKVVVERQRAGIAALKKAGIVVKVNSILLEGINDQELVQIAKEYGALGVDMHNIIPLLPVPGTAFESLPHPSHERLAALRAEAGAFIPQMLHCSRCRADAAGTIGSDSCQAKALMAETLAESSKPSCSRPHVAVASQEGLLVNMHLGEADRLWVFAKEGDAFKCVGVRPTPPAGGGESRWVNLAKSFDDCSSVLVSGAGDSPIQTLATEGIKVIVMEGIIEQALADVFAGRAIRAPVRKFKCGSGCAGSGLGCSA